MAQVSEKGCVVGVFGFFPVYFDQIRPLKLKKHTLPLGQLNLGDDF
jgi:hypothetical protein